MGSQADHSDDETERLRQGMNDLVSLLAVPAAWSGCEAPQVVRVLSDSLVRMLQLDFIYVRLNRPDGTFVETVSQNRDPAISSNAVIDHFHDVPSYGDWPSTVRDTAEEVEISVATLHLGLQADVGTIVAGSRRRDFPLQTENLLLSVAANQATIKFHELRQSSDQPRLARELDERVAQRTSELAVLNDTLQQEIAERKRVEAALRESEHNARMIVDSIPAGISILSPTGEVEAVNARVAGYFGRTHQELKGWATSDAAHPEDLPGIVERVRGALANGEPYDFEARLLGADGTYRWFQVRALPFRDDSRQIVRWYSLHTDIDERKRAEEALQASEVSLRNIINAIPAMAWSTRPDGYCDFLNDRWLDYAEYTAEQAQGWGWTAALHPDDAGALAEIWQRHLASGTAVQAEARMLGRDGKYRWFLFLANPLRDESGKIIKWYGSNIDIEDRRRSDQALRTRERDLAQIINTIPTAVWSTRPDGYCDFLHHRWLDYAGMSAEEAEGWGWQAAIHPDDIESAVNHWRTALASGTSVKWEARMRRFDGVYRWFLFLGDTLRDESGGVLRWYGTNVDIDDRKHAEEALAESERQTRLVLDTIPGLVTMFTADGQLNGGNQQLLDYFQQPLDEVKRWATNGMIHPDDLQYCIDSFVGAVESGEPYDYESRLRRFDGTYRWFQISGLPLKDGNGRIVRWYGLLTDIDDRKRVEAALAEREREYRLMADSIVMIAIFTPEGELIGGNQQLTDYFQQALEDVARWATNGMTHPDDLQHSIESFRASVASGDPYDYEARFRRFDGIYRWFHIRGHPLKDAEGRILRWYGLLTDVDDRKRIEWALAEREREARLMADSIVGMIALFNPAGELIGGNQQLLDYFKQPLEEVGRWATNGMTHPDDLQHCIDVFMGSVVSGEPYDYETRFRRFDGVYRWFQLRGHPLRDADGRIVRWYGLLTDVEDRKRVEDELRRSEASLADAQRLSRTGSFSWLIGTETFTWSEEMYRIYGMDPKIALTLDLMLNRVHPDDVANVRLALERSVADGSGLDFETRLVLPDESVKHVHVVATYKRNNFDELELAGAVQDVTASWLAEEALGKARSELTHFARVTSLGALTASIAHEVNQPLSGIITNTSACLRMLAEEPPNIVGARETAHRTIRDGNRAADIITRLRALFTKRAVVTEAVDLQEAVREVVALLSGDLHRSRVVLRTDFADGLPAVLGDRVQLQQVIVNLLRNAAEAMDGIDDRPRQVIVSAEPTGDGHILLSVRDAGVGFDSQEAQRVFEAFYTTKTDGMGIGLSVSRSIIESHGGRLWMERNDGPGLTFSFSLPEFVEDRTIILSAASLGAPS